GSRLAGIGGVLGGDVLPDPVRGNAAARRPPRGCAGPPPALPRRYGTVHPGLGRLRAGERVLAAAGGAGRAGGGCGSGGSRRLGPDRHLVRRRSTAAPSAGHPRWDGRDRGPGRSGARRPTRRYRLVLDLLGERPPRRGGAAARPAGATDAPADTGAAGRPRWGGRHRGGGATCPCRSFARRSAACTGSMGCGRGAGVRRDRGVAATHGGRATHPAWIAAAAIGGRGWSALRGGRHDPAGHVLRGHPVPAAGAGTESVRRYRGLSAAAIGHVRRYSTRPAAAEAGDASLRARRRTEDPESVHLIVVTNQQSLGQPGFY